MRATEQLQQLVRERGEAVTATRIRVDTFLNHRVDPKVLDLIAAAAQEQLAGTYDLVLTAEAGGIAPASAVATTFRLPMVFARKYQLIADSAAAHVRRVKSPTKGEAFDLAIARREFADPGRVLIVDDVLAGGTTAEVLGEFVEEAGGTVAGVLIVVDKTFQAGHGRLRDRGWKLTSLVPIASLEGGITLGHAARSADVATTVGWS